MDPNTRSLIQAKFNDIENDMEIFQMLRGKNKEDLEGRKKMMRECKIDKSLIDT